MIIKTGNAEDHLLYVVDVYKDSLDNIVSRTSFETFDEFYRYITETTFEDVDGLNCCLTIFHDSGISMNAEYENCYSFKDGKIDLEKFRSTLDSMVDTIDRYGSSDVGLVRREIVLTQGLFDYKHSDDYKNIQKIRYKLNNRIRVCSKCFDTLDNCTCSEPDAGIFTISKTFQPFLKTLGGTFYIEDETGYPQEWVYDSIEENIETNEDRIKGVYYLQCMCETYKEISGFETFPESEFITNDTAGGFEIRCEGETPEEYEQDKARKFKIFNDWAKDFREKHTVEPSSIKEYLEDDKIYDTDKYVYVCPHCFAERTECVCDECKEYIEIDRNIYPAIRNLNRAGYRTAFCCEGHKKEYPYGNIVFSHFYHFDHIPDFCRYSHNGNLEFCYEGSTDEEFEADKKKKLEELIAWSESFLK